jgi:hypothetical protein
VFLHVAEHKAGVAHATSHIYPHKLSTPVGGVSQALSTGCPQAQIAPDGIPL